MIPSAGRLALLPLLLVLAVHLLLAAPASAHAELVSTDPPDGSRLSSAPTSITLHFTEGVSPISGGLRLLDSDGAEVATPEPVVSGSEVRWPMPPDLPDGAYVVSWRVLSSDTHPVAGAFSFGVGVAAPEAGAGAVAAPVVTWTVTATRFAGYAAVAVLLGFLAVGMHTWPRDLPRPSWLWAVGLGGIVVGLLGTVLGLLVQGPYVAALPLRELADARLLGETSHTAFGGWMQVRFFVYLGLLAVIWQDPLFRWRMTRGLSLAGAAGLAVTFSGTSHAAASGRVWDLAVDTVHVLAAGTWTGGLLFLALLALPRRGDRVPVEVVGRFSRLALASVVALVATGSVSALIHLQRLPDLWETDYGRLLAVKLVLVLVALTAAAVSRHRVSSRRIPGRSVTAESVTTLVVLAVTSVLAMTAPPSGTSAPEGASAGGGAELPEAGSRDSTILELDLGKGRTARLHVAGLRPGGSELHLEATGAGGEPVRLTDAEVRFALPARDLGPLSVTLERAGAAWVGQFDFPLPGKWQVVLTVHDESLAGVVTTGMLRISR